MNNRDGGKYCSSRGNVRAVGGSAIKRDGKEDLKKEKNEKKNKGEGNRWWSVRKEKER